MGVLKCVENEGNLAHFFWLQAFGYTLWLIPRLLVPLRHWLRHNFWTMCKCYDESVSLFLCMISQLGYKTMITDFS